MLNIIIPCYNHEDDLRQALNSLAIQTRKMFTVTVVNDGSEADYQPIIDEFKGKLKIFSLTTPHNLGCGGARQYGLDHTPSNFDYIMFMDMDDILYPRAVEILYAEAKRNNADIVSSAILQEELHGPGIVLQPERNQIWLHGKIYRNAFLKEKNIRFIEEAKFGEDTNFNLIAFEYAERKFSIDETTYLWHANKNSLTRQFDSNFYKYGYTSLNRGLVKNYMRLLLDNKVNNVFSIITNLYSNEQIAALESDYEMFNILREETRQFLNSDIVIDKLKETISKVNPSIIASARRWKDKYIIFNTTFISWLWTYEAEEIIKVLKENFIGEF